MKLQHRDTRIPILSNPCFLQEVRQDQNGVISQHQWHWSAAARLRYIVEFNNHVAFVNRVHESIFR